MNLEELIQKLKAHVEAQSSKLVCDDSESLLEMLYDVYAESNSFDNEAIRKDFHKLYRLLNGIPLKEMDKIADPVCALCRDHEMAGFIHGVQAGIRKRSTMGTLQQP